MTDGNLVLPGRSKLGKRMVSSILGPRGGAGRLEYDVPGKKKKVKHRPHQSNQNRMMGAGSPKRPLAAHAAYRTQVFVHNRNGGKPPPISERHSHRNAVSRRLLPEGICTGCRALFSDAHSRLEVKPGPYGQTLSAHAGRATKVVRLRITPNFSYAGKSTGSGPRPSAPTERPPGRQASLWVA